MNLAVSSSKKKIHIIDFATENDHTNIFFATHLLWKERRRCWINLNSFVSMTFWYLLETNEHCQIVMLANFWFVQNMLNNMANAGGFMNVSHNQRTKENEREKNSTKKNCWWIHDAIDCLLPLISLHLVMFPTNFCFQHFYDGIACVVWSACTFHLSNKLLSTKCVCVYEKRHWFNGDDDIFT